MEIEVKRSLYQGLVEDGQEVHPDMYTDVSAEKVRSYMLCRNRIKDRAHELHGKLVPDEGEPFYAEYSQCFEPLHDHRLNVGVMFMVVNTTAIKILAERGNRPDLVEWCDDHLRETFNYNLWLGSIGECKPKLPRKSEFVRAATQVMGVMKKYDDTTLKAVLVMVDVVRLDNWEKVKARRAQREQESTV